MYEVGEPLHLACIVNPKSKICCKWQQLGIHSIEGLVKRLMHDELEQEQNSRGRHSERTTKRWIGHISTGDEVYILTVTSLQKWRTIPWKDNKTLYGCSNNNEIEREEIINVEALKEVNVEAERDEKSVTKRTNLYKTILLLSAVHTCISCFMFLLPFHCACYLPPN